MTTTMAIDFKDQDRGRGYTFRGSEHGDVPVSILVDRSQPGEGPALHRHPYDEVWVLEQGTVTFTAGDRSLPVTAGTVVTVPAGEFHGFTNTGTTPLQMVCIHTRARIETEWLEPRERAGS
ncbi:MAG: cupin domain-containing protein [Candidatus Dormibacteraeota bacterium]|nr:cupin domain-containing protein [Candidatus Dormibacteraeota bacterium]